MSRNVFLIIHSVKPPKDTTTAKRQVCWYSGSCRDLTRGNQLSHAAVATPLSDSMGCATASKGITWKYCNGGLLTMSRSDCAVMLGLLLKPRVGSLQGRVDACHRKEQGKLTGIFLLYTADKGHSPFLSFATFQKICLLLCPSH